MGALGLSIGRASSANTDVAWALSDTTGLHNDQKGNRTWSDSTLRFLIVCSCRITAADRTAQLTDEINAALLCAAGFVKVHVMDGSF
jgi:hypothetical protein